MPSKCNKLMEIHKDNFVKEKSIEIIPKNEAVNNVSKSNQISLKRVSIRLDKKEGIFWSGYMIYYTKSYPEVTKNQIE